MAKPEYHEQPRASPVLREKLQYRCDAVRKFFDTKHRDFVQWEKWMQ